MLLGGQLKCWKFKPASMIGPLIWTMMMSINNWLYINPQSQQIFNFKSKSAKRTVAKQIFPKSESIFSVRNCGFPVVSHAVSDFWMTIFTKIVVSVEILRKISVWYTFAYYRPTIFPKICFFPSSYRWITTMTVSPVLKSESS